MLSLRFKRSIRDVVRVDRVDPTRVVIVFTPETDRSDRPDRVTIVFGQAPNPPEDGHIVQFFTMPTTREAENLYQAVSASLVKSVDWSGSLTDLTAVGLE